MTGPKSASPSFAPAAIFGVYSTAQDSDEPQLFRATLVGKAKGHPVLWTGDLLTRPGGEPRTYKAGAATVKQYFPNIDNKKLPATTVCRVALFSDGAPELAYSCAGDRPTFVPVTAR